jgi:hypothetical protein
MTPKGFVKSRLASTSGVTYRRRRAPRSRRHLRVHYAPRRRGINQHGPGCIAGAKVTDSMRLAMAYGWGKVDQFLTLAIAAHNHHGDGCLGAIATHCAQ